MRNWMKNFLAISLPITGLLLVGFGFFLYFPLVVKHFAVPALEAYGLRAVTFDVVRPTATDWGIKNVSFQAVLDNKSVLVESSELRIGYQLAELFQGRLSELVLSEVRIHSDSTTLNAELLRVEITSQDSAAIRGVAVLRGLTTKIAKRFIPKIDVEAEFTVLVDKANSTLKIRGSDSPFVLIGAIELIRASQDMALRLSLLPISWNVLTPLLESQGVKLPKQLTVQQAKIKGHMGADWQTDSLQNQFLSMDIEGVNLSYNKIVVLGGNASLRSAGFSPFKMRKPAQVRIKEVNPGLPIKNVSAELLLKPGKASNTIVASNVRAEILGGSILIPTFVVDSASWQGSAQLQVAKIDLEKVLELYPQQKVSAQGTVSGVVPFAFSAAGVTVQKGKLQSDGKGRIRAQLLDTEQQASLVQQSVGVASKALENYWYDSLKAGVDLDRKGNLDIALSLAGRNPDYQNGRSINFNVNVGENIPALLKSLQITSDISEFGARQ